MYLDAVVEGDRYLAIREDMTIQLVRHRPYFYVVSRERLSKERVVEEIKKVGRVRGYSGDVLAEMVVSVQETDLKPFVFDEQYRMYYVSLADRVYKVETREPKPVAYMGEALAARGFKVGACNVRYRVRLSFDIIAPSILGVEAPVIFKTKDDAISLLLSALKKLRGRKVLAFDIEVESRGTFPRPGDPLLSISVYPFRFLVDMLEGDEDIKRATKDVVVFSHGDTEEMVADFMEYLDRERPIAVVGWNSIDFDAKYMKPFVGGDASIAMFHFRVRNRAYPHIDLFRLRKAAGQSLGLRSHAAFALDDVAEDLGIIARGGEVATIEASVDRSNMVALLERDPETFHKYIRIDAALTAAIGMRWLAIIYSLAVATGIAPTALQELNSGQIYEYVTYVRFLEMMGFAPTLRTRELEYGKMKALPSVYARGKVIVPSYGPKRNIMIIDFASMFPNIMYWMRVDPVSVVPLDIETENRRIKLPLPAFRRVSEREAFYVALGVKKSRSSGVRIAKMIAKVVTTASVLEYPIANALFLRLHVKKLKRGGGEDAEIFGYVDKALKIFINAGYGGMAKERGNMLNEIAAAYVFYKSNEIQMLPILLIEEIALGNAGGPSRDGGADGDEEYGGG